MEHISMTMAKSKTQKRLIDYVLICWEQTDTIYIEAFREVDDFRAEEAAYDFLRLHKVPTDHNNWILRRLENTVDINITNIDGYQTTIEI